MSGSTWAIVILAVVYGTPLLGWLVALRISVIREKRAEHRPEHKVMPAVRTAGHRRRGGPPWALAGTVTTGTRRGSGRAYRAGCAGSRTRDEDGTRG